MSNYLFIRIKDIILNLETIETIGFHNGKIHYTLKNDWNRYTVENCTLGDFDNASYRILNFSKKDE